MITDFFDDRDEFEVMLSTAIHNAYTAWEKRFVSNLHDRYLLYGDKLLIEKNAAHKVKELQSPYKERGKK